jgi:hypothetical protein
LVVNGLIHHIKHLPDLLERELGMEDVRHAIDEDALRFTPPEWLHQPLRPEPGSEGVLTVGRRVFHGGLA